MQINRAENNTSFGIKVSQNFINAAHNHYNYNVIHNKKQNIYHFNSFVDRCDKFGYDYYTLDYRRKFEKGNWQHYLYAVSDDGKREVVIAQRQTLVRLIDKFFKLNRYEIRNKMKNKNSQNL